jgi:Zn-finger nucleic acid-binding protein
MLDIFDNQILCKNCKVEMQKTIIRRNGFELRAIECPRCKEQIIHPADLNASQQFNDLKGKTFSVKLRMVGNSHAISIPKEIVDFMNETQRMHNDIRKEMDNMVKLCFEDFGNLRINLFDNTNQEEFMKLKVKKLRGVSNG